MELFSEVHGLYYQMIQEILQKAHKEPMTKQQIYDVLQEKGFQETLYNLSPKLLDTGTAESYNLLIQDEEGYHSILNAKPMPLMTNLEKMWLKTMLSDKRIKLFFDNTDLESLEKSLWDVETLYDHDSIITVGQANDGDPYADTKYREHFQKILHGITHKKLLRITYSNSKGITKRSSFAPHRLEYSIKDDKFRLNAVLINRGRMLYFSKINLARMIRVDMIEDAKHPSDVGAFIHSHKKTEPIEIELSNERQGFERCFIHLSNYERNSEYDEEAGTCRIKLYYYDVDEPELIIMLLSYGPILKVLGPPAFKKKIQDRILRQKELFIYHNQWDG